MMNENEQVQTPTRKANDCFANLSYFAPAQTLFDEFWRSGELALMFGASGTGKSILAVQLGDAIARGARIDGFRMHAARKKVLYVDLVHSDLHYQRRYAYYPDGASKAKHYRFSERFHRERPESAADVADWVRKKVSTEGFEVVIIDDLAAVRVTAESSRETTKLMRELRKICDEFGTSILAIIGAEAGPGRAVNECDLRRNRSLCGIADSVFAIGRQ